MIFSPFRHRKPPFRHQKAPALLNLLSLTLCCCCLLCSALADITQGGGGGSNQATLRVRPLQAEVTAGEWVDIPVEVLGAGLRRVDFELIQAPAAGQVTAPEPLILEGNPQPQRLLRFDARAIQEPGRYNFRFRAVARGARPSAAVDALVEVLPSQIRLFAPEALDFGTVFYGQVGEQLLNLENAGLRPLSLTAQLEGADWRWKNQPQEAVASLEIPATAAINLPVEFLSSPTAAERAQITLTSPSGEKTILLTAKSSSLLSIEPNSLQAAEAPEAAEPNQANQPENEPPQPLQDLSLTNESQESLSIQLLGSPQLQLPETVILQAGESRQIAINPNWSELSQGAEGTLTLSFQGQSKTIDWNIPAQAARAELLDAQGQPLSSPPVFAAQELGAQQRLPLRIRNIGGKTDFLFLKTEPPFFLELKQEELQLAPGQELEFELLFNAAIVGAQTSQFSYGFGLKRAELPLQVEVIAPPEAPSQEENQRPQVGDSPRSVNPAELTGASTPRRKQVTRQAINPADLEGMSAAEVASRSLATMPEPQPTPYQITPTYDKLTHNKLALSWPLPKDRDDLANLQWEASWLDEESNWVTIPQRVEIDTTSNRASFRLEGITPGASFFLRFQAKNPQTQELVGNSAFHIVMEPRPSLWQRIDTFFWITLAASAVGGVAFWWFRLR